MKLVLKFMPSIKQIFTGHSNPYELQAYCKDVYAKAKEMNIPLPRYEAQRASF